MKRFLLAILVVGFVGSSMWGILSSGAEEHARAAGEQPAVTKAETPTMHPPVVLLDETGRPVLETGNAVSTLKTCGKCHDTEFIQTHSRHASAGMERVGQPGNTGSGRSWDFGPGMFGGWNPITYRYLTLTAVPHGDLGLADWIRYYGRRHVGGGPAQKTPDGTPLEDLRPGTTPSPFTHVVDPATDTWVPWNWKKSGTVEMDCFLCHIPNPDHESRVKELQAGRFRWASTATLSRTGIASRRGDGWRWNREAFTADGHVRPDRLRIQDPDDGNCGQCHGLVQANANVPVLLTECKPEYWITITTGQIISPQKISDSGMNIAGKENRLRSWDIHAERLVKCTDCHYSTNNPIYHEEPLSEKPTFLKFDGRRMDIGEYLHRPSHDFAAGESYLGLHPEGTEGGMRRCASCHDTETTHKWLPYKDRHMDVLSCEACHIPRINSSTRSVIDWTVITEDGEPRTVCRGVEGDRISPDVLITGYEPVLLPRREPDGGVRLSPYNLLTSWFWVFGEPERPVPVGDLEKAFLENGRYRKEIVKALDSDWDGKLDGNELVLDEPHKVDVVRGRLEALGLDSPHIVGEIEPYGIHHDVTGHRWATKSCQSCHDRGETRLSRPFVLASYLPGGVMPHLAGDARVDLPGEIFEDESGDLVFAPSSGELHLYVLGHDRVWWANGIGLLAVLGVIFGVGVHGGLRFLRSRGKPRHEAPVKPVYMYTAYERFWHWLQALAIILLLVTGIEIHFAGSFNLFGFETSVRMHNILGFIVVINALFAAFYNLASGEIRQYLPAPRGYFNQAITQARYYLSGIFRGEPHPFEKNPHRKLNPLQQVTYLAILNVLLPLQVITGLAMWGAQHWPHLAQSLGGLYFLAPLHAFGAWLFAAFLVMHMYLTTTGHTPVASVKAMVVGWEETEESGSSASLGEAHGSE